MSFARAFRALFGEDAQERSIHEDELNHIREAYNLPVEPEPATVSTWVQRAQANDLPVHSTLNSADAYRTTRS